MIQPTVGRKVWYWPNAFDKYCITPHAWNQGAAGKMLEDEVMVGDALPFNELMQACAQVQPIRQHARRRPINAAARHDHHLGPVQHHG